MNYYYFAATLPVLNLDRQPPLGIDEFLESCRTHLAEGDMLAVQEAIAADGAVTQALSSSWRTQDMALRNAIVRARASRMNVDPSPHLHESTIDTTCEQAVADAYARRNPHEREWALDCFRWGLLDEMAGFNPFSLNAIVAYALKLRLAERWSALDVDRGRQKMESIVTAENENTTG